MTSWESEDKLVKKEIVRAGQFSNKATEKSICNVQIDQPLLIDHTLQQIREDFHSEILNEESKKVIVIGEACSTIDKLIERAIQTMHLNEQSLITIQYSDNDSKDKTNVLSVPVTLESVEFYKPIYEWSPEEKYETALKYKEKGVELFKAKRYVDAFYRFSKACKILITLEPIVDLEESMMNNVVDLKIILYNNMAECQLMKGNYEHTVTLCNKVLIKEKNNVKALYRRGVAHGNLKDFEKATNDLKIVLNLEPKDRKAQEKYNIYNEQWRLSVKGYENIVRKMFKT